MMVAPSGEIVRRNSLLHLAKVSGVSDASFALDACFGKELKANPASDFEANQEVLGRQDYSAYGSVVAQSGLIPSVGYGGMWPHHDSGNNLTWYRGYQPAAGRWLSRDSLEENWGRGRYPEQLLQHLRLADVLICCLFLLGRSAQIKRQGHLRPRKFS